MPWIPRIAGALCLAAAGAAAEPLALAARHAAPPGHDVGRTVALAGSRVVLGGQVWDHEDETVLLFDAGTGRPSGRLVPPGRDWYGPFVRALDAEGGRVLVCARGHPRSAVRRSTALLFALRPIREIAHFVMPAGRHREHGQFGGNCAVSGRHVAISATRLDGAHKNEGAVFLYDADTGDPVRTIRSPEPRRRGFFGSEVALSDGHLAIAQADTSGALPWHGSVYVYDLASGALRHVFRRPEGSRGYFATSLAMADGRILIGSTIDRVGRRKSGLAFLYDLETRALLARLAPPPEHHARWFGNDVALWGERALVGAFDADLGAREAGAAYLFDATDGTPLQVLAHPAGEAGAQFGAAVDLGPAGAVIGAPGEHARGRGDGAVYHFRWDTP